MKKSLFVGLGLVIAAIVIALVVAQGTEAPSKSTNNTNASNNSESADEANDLPASTSTTITYTDDGFSPRNYTVKAGTTMTVVNESGDVLEFSSDDHPEHTDNTELNTSAIDAGESVQFTPNTKGTWGFHNHENELHDGTLIVE